MGFIVKLLKFAIAVAMLPMVWSFLRELIPFLGRAVGYSSVRLFLAGLAGYLLAYILGLRKLVRFAEDYVHETAHVVGAYLTLRPVKKMLVYPDPKKGEEGSHVAVPPGILDFVFYLIPYCLPLLTLPLLLARVLVPGALVPIVNLLIGITTGFFCVQPLIAIAANPSDFKQAGGWFFSTVIVVLANIILWVVVLSFVIGEIAGIGVFFRVAWDRTLASYRAVIQSWEDARRPA